MNKEWSEMNKTLRLQIKRKDTFATGIDTLLELRRNLMEQIVLDFSTNYKFQNVNCGLLLVFGGDGKGDKFWIFDEFIISYFYELFNRFVNKGD